MKKKAIVYTVDGSVDCLLQLVTSIRSVRRLQPEPFDIYILTDRPRPWMNDICGARIVDVGHMVGEYGLGDTGIIWRKHPVPPMLLFRLLIPIVPELKGYDQILYLDTDTEVWDKRFFGIFDIDFNCEVIAVKDTISHNSAARRLSATRANGGDGWKDPSGIYSRWDDVIHGDGKYANSGVLVFNMWNVSDGYDARVRYIMGKVRELKPYYSDQDTLNAYYKVFVVDDRRYNGWRRAEAGAFLRHYIGSDRALLRAYPKICGTRPNAVLDGIKPNDRLGVLSGVVDHVYVLANSGKPEDFGRLEAWMSRNGISEYTKIDTADTGLYSGLLDVLPHEANIKAGHMDNWVGHYRAVTRALAAGYDKIAVFEDTFNPNGLENHLKELSPDFDLAICDAPGEFRRSISYLAGSSKGYIAGMKCMVDLRRLFESLFDEDTDKRQLRYVHKWMRSQILDKERTFVRS